MNHKKLFALIAIVVTALAAIPLVCGGAKKLSCKRHAETGASAE